MMMMMLMMRHESVYHMSRVCLAHLTAVGERLLKARRAPTEEATCIFSVLDHSIILMATQHDVLQKRGSLWSEELEDLIQKLLKETKQSGGVFGTQAQPPLPPDVLPPNTRAVPCTLCLCLKLGFRPLASAICGKR